MIESGGRATPNWEGTISALEEVLEDVLDSLAMERAEGIRADVRALNAFDEIDRFMSAVKQELGV